MKYLLILGLLILLGAFLYWRLRPYINFARRVFGAVRDARVSVGSSQQNDFPSQRQRAGAASSTPQKLVRCATCGTWTPATRALSLRSSASLYYCSHACIERAAETPPTQRSSKSAS